MNVIVSNKQKGIIDKANIDAIKDLNGLFNVNDLINKLKNYFFSKMILDATSVIDFASSEVLKKLVDEIGADRLIILLPSTPEPPLEFKKELINLKVYNFSNDINDIVKFLEKPNTYENAMNQAMNAAGSAGEFYVDSSIKEGQSNDEEIIGSHEDNHEELSTNDNYGKEAPIHSSFGDIMSRFNIRNSVDSDEENHDFEEDIHDEEYDDTPDYQDESSDFNEKQDVINTSDFNSQYDDNKNIFLNMDGFDDVNTFEKPKEKRVIGFKNITLHAGSTTLIYMLQKAAMENNKDVLSIEVNQNDFKLFRNSKMLSVKESDILDTINFAKESFIFVDLNDCVDDSFCNEIIYLVEPSTIKLNKLMMNDKTIFNSLKEKKVILNQSMLNSSDIPILEKEAGIKFFFNIGSMNDRISNSVIHELLDKLLIN